MQVFYLGRSPRTKETLPDFLKWCRVTRHPLVFRGLTGSQRTPGFWGVTLHPSGRDASTPARSAVAFSGLLLGRIEKLPIKPSCPTSL